MRRLLRAFRRRTSTLALAALVAVGCYEQGAGQEPADKGLYFPTGLAISPSGRFLFAASSNFDLRFNSGTLQAFDLNLIAEKVAQCREAKNTGKADLTCNGGGDEASNAVVRADVFKYVKASVRIGAFAADMEVIPLRDRSGVTVPAKGRLLIPVRGDASLTAIDFEEKGDEVSLFCTGSGATPMGTRCASEWKLGTDATKNSRQLTLEGEPFAVAVPAFWPTDPAQQPAKSGGVAAVAHQTTGNVSLFVDVGIAGSPPQGKLAYVLGGLAGGGTAIAALDLLPTSPGEDFVPRFLVTNRSQSNVFVLSFFPDPNKERAGLVLSDIVPLPVQSSGFDSRGIVVDPPNTGETRNTRVFLTNRTPAALVVGEVEPSTRRLHFYENVALPVGPSRVTRAVLNGRSKILAAAFDARMIVIYDPDARRITNVVRTHRGPYSIVVDEGRSLAYICNFTDSSIQVIDLDEASAGKPSYQQIVYSVGAPSGPSR